ncbi:MAG: anion permease [Caldilineaceae bacterium]
MGDALTKTGASAWFAELVAPCLTGLPYVVVLAALILLAFSLTQFLNNVPLGAILTPVLITLGSATGVDPVRLVIPAIFTVALAFSLPSGSARMTLIAVTGAVSSKDMIRSALWVGLPSAVVIFVFFYLASIVGFI